MTTSNRLMRALKRLMPPWHRNDANPPTAPPTPETYEDPRRDLHRLDQEFHLDTETVVAPALDADTFDIIAWMLQALGTYRPEHHGPRIKVLVRTAEAIEAHPIPGMTTEQVMLGLEDPATGQTVLRDIRTGNWSAAEAMIEWIKSGGLTAPMGKSA